MKILILGADGYLGHPTALHLAARGHEVWGADNGLKRTLAANYESESLTKSPRFHERASAARRLGLAIEAFDADCREYDQMRSLLQRFRPDVVVHYAEIPSAPYSMLGYEQARLTLNNNLDTTLALAHAVMDVCPDVHLVKLGTMGEYGTPNVAINEGWLDYGEPELEDADGKPIISAATVRRHRFLYPAEPGSLYHASKVADTHVLWLYCRAKGLRVTDVMQGPVWGLRTPETAQHLSLTTTFHYDDLFGTVINRFVAQALAGHPLTVYGSGGQTRGFIHLRDVVRCVELMCENPPERGELRIVNQITAVHSVRDLADMVVEAARSVGIEASVGPVRNPRAEAEEHFYRVEADWLREHGLENTVELGVPALAELIEDVRPYAGMIGQRHILPRDGWSEGYKK